MKRFTFNLEKVLELRKYRERETEIELGRAVGALTEIENHIKALGLEKNRAARRQFEPEHSASVIINYELYLRRLDGEVERLIALAAEAELEVEKARALYLEASRERKVLDKLKEKRERDYRKAMGREETRTLDDISSGAPARKILTGG
ncbi:MAG: flagellar export protein FliJ [Treponema sp.]|jgi:flagellar FliJ protein|nr:flagellar export protein FliJ [Treponema sp.]